VKTTPGVLNLILRAKRGGVEKNSYEDGSRQARTVKLFILRAKRSGVEKSWRGWFSTGSNGKAFYPSSEAQRSREELAGLVLDRLER